MMDIEDRWENLAGNEYLKFDRVENKLSDRPDLHAFILLDRLFPGERKIVSAATHDQIYLDVDLESIATLADDKIIELSRCGVMISEDSLSIA